MQISSNTTGMDAGLCVATDKEGRDSCVVVVKGTFAVAEDGEVALAEEQVPLVYADEHYGDPGETCIRYECDFAPFKPRCDVLLNGSAWAPRGRAAPRITVGLRVGSVDKSFDVIGERHWRRALLWSYASRPEPFTRLPITYDRAYGGTDASERKPDKVKTFVRNPNGAGYYPRTRGSALEGRPLANTAPRGQGVKRRRSKRYRPMSFGPMSRNFPERIAWAGTYDQQWLDEHFPFLPPDFDERYFQSAPADQQTDHLQGGELVRCTNLSPDGLFAFRVPERNVPVVCRFRDREERPEVRLDTLIVEPDERRFVLVWRTRVALGRKMHSLHEILVGPRPKPKPQRKRHYPAIGPFVAHRRAQASRS
jgi:hypothetical protein